MEIEWAEWFYNATNIDSIINFQHDLYNFVKMIKQNILDIIIIIILLKYYD